MSTFHIIKGSYQMLYPINDRSHLYILCLLIGIGSLILSCEEQATTPTPSTIQDQEVNDDIPIVSGGTNSLPTDDNCNGIDDDQDGSIDEGILCLCIEMPTCYGAPLDTLGVGVCKEGLPTCDSAGEIWRGCEGWVGPTEEVCDLVDNDCDGSVDENFESCEIAPCQDETRPCLTEEIDIEGDCVTIECPADAPYPVACEIEFQGEDARGCVANTLGESVIFLKEGNDCGIGSVRGSLTCSTAPGSGLNAETCPMNKMIAFYPETGDQCPVDD
jgi:hypothetical protein